MLVIAGTDSSGGAGLVNDVQVVSNFGARIVCAVTAVTAQTHSRVDAACELSPEVVRRQLRAALRSGPVDAVKIGMLGSGAIVRAVLEELPDRMQMPIVVDPVLMSSSGAALLDSDGVALLRDHLLSRCTLVTPNLMEAATLLGCEMAMTIDAQFHQAKELLRFGTQAVLLKGGHGSQSEATDVLATPSTVPVALTARRVNAVMRGTGCGLSSAIAALLATGMSLESACRKAKAYIHERLLAIAT
ncbi:MAG TPA: bifunctional hydroxymethylpyrimidine kinase/phosphomethylpyrimidine kinase [Steroidobacter sp.]|uniref:bifunctional hydroxymethylpyrimidine kinase/phosphomethylpyrimidine kinase n=1 Tax=Steroidobacter sp. TaxID=1978227 RepID=UPI002EDA35B5